jgi:fructose 1,6-bisphosphate aldolase/phosphatase
MEYAKGDSVLDLDAPEEHLNLAVLLRGEKRFGIQVIHFWKFPKQQLVAVSTDRLHTIAGEYKGEDEPVAIVRVQGSFSAPEEVISAPTHRSISSMARPVEATTYR